MKFGLCGNLVRETLRCGMLAYFVPRTSSEAYSTAPERSRRHPSPHNEPYVVNALELDKPLLCHLEDVEQGM